MAKKEYTDQIPDSSNEDIRDENNDSAENTEESESTVKVTEEPESVDLKVEKVTSRKRTKSPAEKIISCQDDGVKETNDDAETVVKEVTSGLPTEDPLSKLEIHEQLLQAEAESEEEAEISEAGDEISEIDFSTLSKEQILEKLDEAVNNEDINKVKTRITAIKVEFLRIIKEEKLRDYEKFLAESGAPEDYMPIVDPAEERFQQIFEIYKVKKHKYNELLEKQKYENLLAKQKILDALKALVNSEESLKKTYDEFKTLQERWKEIGQIPRAEINNLWQNYHFLVEKFFDKVKINKELKDLDLKKNLEQKMQLCEKAEELLLSPSIHRSFKQLQKYHDEWKEIGPVPQDKKDEIWERFKTVSDRINLMRKDYYNSLQEEQENNLLAKNALCDKLESLLGEEIGSMQVWKEKTVEVNEMMELWQSIGRAPVKANDEIWLRFKKSVNAFYNIKKEFFDSLKEQQINNYNVKVNLCLQAESLKTSTNWKQTTYDFLKIQNEWKNIGPVPRKYSDKIWKRFRAACDEFFQAKSHYFSNINKMEDENLAKKIEIIRQIDEFPVGENKNANLEALRNFQRTWMEIGHIPIEQKDKLQNDFRSAVNRLLDRLKIPAMEASTFNYKNKIESLQSSPEAGKVIFKEKNMLDGKINKLQSDINLWENNIGFLASSKNADIFKEEFEQKIKSAKEELQLLKAKLKLLIRSNQ